MLAHRLSRDRRPSTCGRPDAVGYRTAVRYSTRRSCDGAIHGGGGENRGEPVRAQRGGLAPAPVGGRATVAAQHAGGRFPGGGRLAGELGPKPAHWRRPARAADLVAAPGRNCYLFAALCKLALGGSDEGLLTWVRTLNREFSAPLADAEVRGVWAVCVPLPGTMARPGAPAGLALETGRTWA